MRPTHEGAVEGLVALEAQTRNRFKSVDRAGPVCYSTLGWFFSCPAPARFVRKYLAGVRAFLMKPHQAMVASSRPPSVWRNRAISALASWI